MGVEGFDHLGAWCRCWDGTGIFNLASVSQMRARMRSLGGLQITATFELHLWFLPAQVNGEPSSLCMLVKSPRRRVTSVSP